MLFEDKVLDGRNRARACETAGIEPKTRVYDGTDPAGYVLSANLHRRHLTASQRAMAIAKFADLPHGGNAESYRAENPNDLSLTIAQAAEVAGVGTATLARAREVQVNGTPLDVAKVQNGEVAVDVMAKEVRARGKTGGPRSNSNLRVGQHVKVPDGFKCLTAAVKPGIELERTGEMNTTAVAKKVGMSLTAYVLVRDAVLLSKRKDLSARDLKSVETAIGEIDGTPARLKHAYELIRPVSLKVWGKNGNRYKTDKTRLKDFGERILYVTTGCSAVADCEIPVLEKKQRADFARDLGRAISALSRLRRRLKREEATE